MQKDLKIRCFRCKRTAAKYTALKRPFAWVSRNGYGYLCPDCQAENPGYAYLHFPESRPIIKENVRHCQTTLFEEEKP